MLAASRKSKKSGAPHELESVGELEAAKSGSGGRKAFLTG
jgi:hypothetical protein